MGTAPVAEKIITSTVLSGMLPEFILRLAVAGILGLLIGLEREYRAKGAGARTHFLVAIGSALIMIASQWGFADVILYKGTSVDVSRVAAQIVSGIGFIGAGTIMMHKEFVRGLTTAAGLWVASGIGIAVGGGLYALGIAGALLTLAGMELLPLLTRNFKVKYTKLVILIDMKKDLSFLTEKMDEAGYRIISFSVEQPKKFPDKFRVEFTITEHDRKSENHLVNFLHSFPELELIVEKIE